MVVRDPSTAIVRWLLQKHACLLFAVIIELVLNFSDVSIAGLS